MLQRSQGPKVTLVTKSQVRKDELLDFFKISCHKVTKSQGHRVTKDKNQKNGTCKITNENLCHKVHKFTKSQGHRVTKAKNLKNGICQISD